MVSKGKLLQALKADIKAAEPLKLQQDAKIREWKAAYDGRPYGNEEVGKSSIVSRDIKKQSEWQHATIVATFVSSDDIVKCSPVTFEDVKAARQNELLLNTQFTRQFDRFNFMTNAVKILDIEGTVVVQTGWEYQEEVTKVEKEVVVSDDNGTYYFEMQEVDEIVVKKNHPTAVIRRNEDIYVDPTCQGDINKAQFVVCRYESDLSTLRQDKRNKNLDKVKDSGDINASDYFSEDTTEFKFSDKSRKKLIVHEYWGNYDVNEDGIAEPIVCIWVNDTIIRMEANPYPGGGIPFVAAPFNAIPFHLYGEANAEFIGDNQKIKTAIIRGMIDDMAQSNNGQVGVKKGALDAINTKRWLAGKNFEFNGSPADFWYGQYNQMPRSAFDMLGLMNNEIESITATKSFSDGINGGSLAGSATGVRGVLDATSTRRMNIVRSIAENLIKPIMRKWMAYNAEFLSDEEVVRVTNDEFIPIRRDDLSGQIDIAIQVSTAEDNNVKSQELSFLLQTLGPSEDPEIRRELMAEIMDLKGLPEQAKRMRSYESKPDPLEEKVKELEIQKLELENKKLASEIARNMGRASEDEADSRLKDAKTAVEIGKARKLESDSDLADLNFIKEDEGMAHKEKLELAELKRSTELDALAFQKMYGGPNEQLGVLD
jgi:hypothetical protein